MPVIPVDMGTMPLLQVERPKEQSPIPVRPLKRSRNTTANRTVLSITVRSRNDLELKSSGRPQPGWNPISSYCERVGAILGEPPLIIRCGPLLAYYTVKDNIYQGAAMIVSPLCPRLRLIESDADP